MRDFKGGMKRQRGRNRGGAVPSGKPQNANRAFESNGPENLKVRGAAQLVYDKYQQLARDAATGGDRVLAENFLQHAEHYYRVLRIMQPQRPASDFAARDPFAPASWELDPEDEGYTPEAAEPVANGGEDANGQGLYDEGRRDREMRGETRSDRERGDREARGERDRVEPRIDRPRDERPAREPRPERFARDDRPEGETREAREARESRFRRDRDDRGPRPSGRYGVPDPNAPPAAPRDPMPVIQPQAARTAAASDDGPMLRSQDGGVFEAPAFLQAAAPQPTPSASADEEPAPRKRAPRKRKVEDAPAAESEEV